MTFGLPGSRRAIFVFLKPTSIDNQEQMAEVTKPRMPRVLVVDDEESVLTFAARALRDAGYEVVVASNGPEALGIVEAQAPFDAFVIDIMMPQMRGDELARQLRHTDPDAKVLYSTGYSDRLFEERKTL